MRLSFLVEASTLEANLIDALGKYHFKKLADPNRPEKTGHSGNQTLPFRTGNQDTPMSPRHRRYFNAPIGANQGKIGWGDVDDAESRRPRPVDDSEQMGYPIDKSPMHKEIEKKARKAFGHLSQHGPPIRRA